MGLVNTLVVVVAAAAAAGSVAAVRVGVIALVTVVGRVWEWDHSLGHLRFRRRSIHPSRQEHQDQGPH